LPKTTFLRRLQNPGVDDVSRRDRPLERIVGKRQTCGATAVCELAEWQKRAPKIWAVTQSEPLKEAACELGADEDFDVLARIVDGMAKPAPKSKSE
jgi:hypothetical protein